jgi:hypothetical protein
MESKKKSKKIPNKNSITKKSKTLWIINVNNNAISMSEQ